MQKNAGGAGVTYSDKETARFSVQNPPEALILALSLREYEGIQCKKLLSARSPLPAGS